VQRVTDIIGEISAASTEQSQGIVEVKGAIGEVDQMTQQNAALVEESAAAAESLKEQAIKLAAVVSTFRLAEGDSSPRVAAASFAAPAHGASADQAIARARTQAVAAKKPATAKPAPVRAPARAPVAVAATTPAAASSHSDWESF
jgi:methyl-accepting chemotaxis protein